MLTTNKRIFPTFVWSQLAFQCHCHCESSCRIVTGSPNPQWLREPTRRKRKKRSSSTSPWIGSCPPPAPPPPHPTTTIPLAKTITIGTLATVGAARPPFSANFRLLPPPRMRYGYQNHPPWRNAAVDSSRTWVSPPNSPRPHLRPYIETLSPSLRRSRQLLPRDQSHWRSHITTLHCPLQHSDPDRKGM